MIEQLQNADVLVQGYFVAGVGLVGVFIVLVLFFFSIKLVHLVDRFGKKSDNTQEK